MGLYYEFAYTLVILLKQLEVKKSYLNVATQFYTGPQQTYLKAE